MRISSLAREIISSQAKVILYGGTTANGGGILAEQLAQLGFTGSFIGSDGIAFDRQFLLHAGSTVNYVYATSMQSAPPNWSPMFVTSYQNYYHTQPTPNSAASYDAAMILITVLKSVIKSNPSIDAKAIRQAVLDKIADPDQPFTGLNGTVVFDSNGDNTMMRTLTVYAIENGQWTYKPADSIDMN
jgi:branched-chain amino acid transport system substrate-binding protein